jgi:beta-galactosidase GanA
MRIASGLGALALLVSPSIALSPRVTNNLTDAVTWDPYSLSILGQRVFLWSGEFHPWRLPSTSLWRDILQKTAAAGMNGVSIYTHWGLNNPSEGVLDFDGFRSLEFFLQEAQKAGLWVTVRPVSTPQHVKKVEPDKDVTIGALH